RRFTYISLLYAQRLATIWRKQLSLSTPQLVLSHAPGHSEIRQTGFVMQVIQDVEGDLFETQLQTRRQITIAISQRRLCLTRRTKGGCVFVREECPNDRRRLPTHLDPLSRVTEVIEVQTKLA